MTEQQDLFIGDDLSTGKYWKEFEEFHNANPDVFRMFTNYAFDAIRLNRKNFGAAMIIQRIRWYCMVETTGSEFKVNNNYSPYYARLFELKFPHYKGFFKTRAIK